jgi:hypothetical protein
MAGNASVNEHLAIRRAKVLAHYGRATQAALEFLPSHAALVGLAWLLVGAGGVMLAVGLYRFYKVRGELNASK